MQDEVTLIPFPDTDPYLDYDDIFSAWYNPDSWELNPSLHVISSEFIPWLRIV